MPLVKLNIKKNIFNNNLHDGLGKMVNPILNKEDIEASREKIRELVVKFDNNKDIYLSKDYKEEEVKVEFISPMFKALGWDVDNERNNAPQFKEVIFEETISVGNKTKNPDYTFQIGGQKIFFLEAKAPHKDLDHDRNPAYQVRRYGWSAKLDLCILTDFEEFAIYETNTKPNKNQRASIGRVKYYKYTDYVEHWEEIYSIFSKEAVMKGLFDKYVEGNEGVKKGTSRVDHEFLKEINYWRELLARNIARRNKHISLDGLNYAVQLTIDRILFFRMAEDRGIEKYKTLYNLADEKDIYQKLIDVFKVADAKYNSGLFCLTADPSKHISRDTVTEDLVIDDKVFKEIFKNLYYPESPYEFSVISPEILGIVYEQFLGSRIRLTDGHQAKIEPKPEIRKAGGVFYTPQPIVKDIIENTIGKLIKNKSLKQIEKIKIIDIACGSGSFILGAYKYLLDHYLNEYLKMKRPPSNVIYQGKDGQWRLTISEKKRILKNNIYGVDIDFLAVEVSKLTLLLQVLEDQNKDVVEQQQTLFHERVLPDLSDNIKNGNTVIETDYITADTDYEELKRIKPFNYHEEFPEVFENDGFDVIITNPPYVRQELLSKTEKDYFKSHYEVFVGTADYYVYFYERAFNLLKDGGYFGLICSNKFTRAKYGKKLRKYLLNYKIISYDDYTGKNVFKDATVDPTVMVMSKSTPNHNKILVDKEFTLNQDDFDENGWSFYSPEILDIKSKILSKGSQLKDLREINIYRGLLTGYNKAFVIDKKTKNKLIAEDKNSEKIIKPLLRGRDIKPNKITFEEQYLILTKNGININDFPAIKNHLSQFRTKLNSRTDKGEHWYNLRACNFYDDFEKPKLIYPNIASHLYTVYDKNKFYTNQKCYIVTSDVVDLRYIHSLMSSKVLNFIFKLLGSPLGSGGYDISKIFVEQLPIVFNDELEDQIVELTDKSIELNNSLSKESTSPNEKIILQKQLTAIDKQIEQLIYQLYDLNDDEIKIIEEIVGL